MDRVFPDFKGEAGESIQTDAAEAEVIAEAYRTAHCGDERAALVAAIADALADLTAAEQRTEAMRRQVSCGYARGSAGAA